MHQENVSVFRLPVTEERSAQNFHLYLSLGQLPPADGRQHRGAEPAQYSQQHGAPSRIKHRIDRKQKQPNDCRRTSCSARDAPAAIYVAVSSCAKKPSDWLVVLVNPAHRCCLVQGGVYRSQLMDKWEEVLLKVCLQRLIYTKVIIIVVKYFLWLKKTHFS